MTTTNYADRVARQRELAAKRRRAKRRDNVILTLLGILVGVLLFTAFILAGGLITMLAWNIGVVALVAAAGGSVGKISLLVAIFVNVAISIVGRVFRPAASVQKS